MRILSLLPLLLIGCTKQVEVKQVIRPVVVEKVELVDEFPPLYFSGFTKAEKFLNVSFRVPGLIQKLPIYVGDRLEPGTLIASIDSADYELELQEKEATLDAADSEARKARAQYRRIKSLYESESASRDELDQARAAHEGAKADVDQAQTLVDLAKKRLSYTKIYSEYPSEVVSKEAEINENVKEGQQIATLTYGDRLEVEVAIPETEIVGINRGKEVEVLINALPTKIYRGIIKEVGVSSSGGTTYPVTVLLSEVHPEIRSGMAAKVVIYNKDQQKLIFAPLPAVGEDKDGKYVFLFVPTGNELGTVKRQAVKIGQIRPNGLTILSGLHEGDEVITAGMRYLKNGMQVRRLKGGM
ncbi:MAG: Toluene efflux pump periplasmic linker protein TtgD [Chlamydiia bacterium]|nr:Toluene efflux pump periplasmic linker protein TtgD [Chlamydiia bacterium]MCH9616253.1 Toluene efflux pump periplasmic linker protein TtgD [Chlamydiia bacterium]MCH9629761.1 Toluene efflux pump periplasmic linker protein TtgD [Chlamydiia bacterium]